MLLLSLSIFFHYYLLHCGQGKANDKHEFMDYSITEFWLNGTPGIDETDRITPQYNILPTPIGWIMNTDYVPNFPLEPSTSIQELETFYPFPYNTTRPSYPFKIEDHTVVTPPRPGPWHIQSPSITPPPNFPSDYRYLTTYPYTLQSAYIPSLTGQPPKGLSVTLPEVDRPEFTYPSFSTPPTPPKSPPGYVPNWVPSSTSFTWNPEREHVKKWQQEISSYAAVRSITPTNVVPMISQVFNYDYTTEGFPEAFRRIQKTTQDASSKLMNSVFEDPTRAVLPEEITVLESNETRGSEFRDKASLYDPTKDPPIQKRTKNTQTLTSATMQSWITDFLKVSMANKDNDIKKTTPRKNISSFLRTVKMLDRPATIPKEEWWQSYQTVPTTLTTVKESLRLIAVTQSYFEMIESLQEGYMMVFLIELTRLIATKERKAVRDVVKHTDRIIYGLSYQSGQLHWLGKPLIDVTTKVTRLLLKLKIDVIQNHAANLHHMLSQRHEELSVEVNTILEYADMLYDDDEGRLLFDALKEFAAFPNISLTGYWLCNSLIHNFLRPYRRLKDTQQRQELMDSVNLLLKTRLTSFGFNEAPPLRDGDVKRADNPPDDAKLSAKKELVTQTECHSDTSLSPRERKRKRHHRSHKRKREGKRYSYIDTDLT